MAVDVLLVGGGTAGHVLPAIATAQALERLAPDLRLAFAGMPGSLEQRLAGGTGHPVHLIDAIALPRRISADLIAVLPRLGRAVRGARAILLEEEVRAVVSFGGYVALPVTLAARGRIPQLLHEQNSRPGLANRVASRYVDRLAVTFPSSLEGFPSSKRVHVTGNPVQQRLRDLDLVARRGEGRIRLGLDPLRQTLLAFGGSQGARSINRSVAASAAAWRRLGLQVLHITGPGDHADACEAWRAAGVDPELEGSGVRAVPFLDDMADAYAAADVAVARAGATTLAELSVLGIPAVLVPYPYATADHQRGNAEALVSAGAAVMLDDADLDAATLVAAVSPIIQDIEQAGRMALAARSWARPHAAESLARLTLELLAPGAHVPGGGGSDG